MLEGGEEPRYLTRRLIRFASEDVGLADPLAFERGGSCEVRPEELVHHVGPRTTGPDAVVDVGFGLCGPSDSRCLEGWESRLSTAQPLLS